MGVVGWTVGVSTCNVVCFCDVCPRKSLSLSHTHTSLLFWPWLSRLEQGIHKQNRERDRDRQTPTLFSLWEVSSLFSPLSLCLTNEHTLTVRCFLRITRVFVSSVSCALCHWCQNKLRRYVVVVPQSNCGHSNISLLEDKSKTPIVCLLRVLVLFRFLRQSFSFR